MRGEVRLGVEGDGAGRVDGEQLLQVEDLDAGAGRLGADEDVVLVGPDLAPGRGAAVGGQAAEVPELALLGDLDEGGALVLAEGDELAAVARGPAGGRGARAGGIAEVRVREEVVEVDVGALEGVVPVAGDGRGPASNALGVAELRVGGIGTAELLLGQCKLFYSSPAHQRRGGGELCPYLGGNLGSLGEEHSRHEGERRKVLTDANHCLLLPTERLTVLQEG